MKCCDPKKEQVNSDGERVCNIAKTLASHLKAFGKK